MRIKEEEADILKKTLDDIIELFGDNLIKPVTEARAFIKLHTQDGITTLDDEDNMLLANVRNFVINQKVADDLAPYVNKLVEDLSAFIF